MINQDKIKSLNSLILRRGFIWGPSPEIYGGFSGFYDYGPSGKALKDKIIKIIKKRLIREGFNEVECPTIMPRIIWEASGHLERFVDPVTKCGKCQSLYRVDKLIKELIPESNPDGLSYAKLEKMMVENNLKCPKCGGSFTEISEYNLMMRTEVGGQEAFLRPETATTTYLLFKRLYKNFREKLPIKIFQLGKAYRNEISPRQGPIRLREFDQLEAQIFITKEQEMNFEEFDEVKSKTIPLIPWDLQKDRTFTPLKISLEEACNKNIIKKPAYAYCLYIAYCIVKELGFLDENIRLRQHSPDEKAHYADDAWDLEIKTTQYGWIEICGIHDRTNYDLKRHQQFSNQDFFVQTKDGKEIPQVLEIAFGIERPLYAILEQSFKIDKDRFLLSLPQKLSPIEAAVFPLISKDKQQCEIAKKIFKELLYNEVDAFYDEAGSIGRRYRRQDELGTPYCITVDFDTLKNNTVTVRERDSMEQKRVNIDKIYEHIKNSGKNS